VTGELDASEMDPDDGYWYKFAGGVLDTVVESYRVDGGDPAGLGLEDDRLSLDAVEWDTLRIDGRIEVPDGLGEYVLEDGATLSEATELLVLTDCIDTHSRSAATTVDDPTSGEESFRFELSSEGVAGSIEVTPVLVRDEPGDSDGYVYGTVPGLKLADGDVFTIDLEGADSGGFLEVVPREFPDEKEDRLFRLDRSVASEPKLEVNSDYGLLEQVLRSGAPHGPKRWTKETLERLVSQPVWLELVLWTASDITDGECQYGWQEEVVAVLAAERDEPPEEFAEFLEDRVADAERVDTIPERGNEVVQDFLGHRRPIEKLLKEVF
jgi:hypothetical protein